MKTKTTAMGVALLLVALAGAAAETPEPENLTWQEANKRSAALIKKDRRSTEGADMARTAFDLYSLQSREYGAATHAQLLLNLVHARWHSSSSTKAIEELDRGVELIARRTGPADPVLIDLWRQGAAVSSSRTEHYFGQAMAVAEAAWGPTDPRTLKLALNMAHDLRQEKSYSWAKSKFLAVRERAAKHGEDGSLVAECDLLLAKIEMERGNKTKATAAFKTLIERLEQRADREQESTLMIAYGMLEYLHEERGDGKAAADIRYRRAQWSEQHPSVTASAGAPATGGLMPLSRVSPQYPPNAANRGVQGFVEFQVDVNPDGTVANVKVLRSEPPGVFEDVASRALRKWKFKPKIVDGKAVASSGTQRVEFVLDPGT